MHAKLLNEFVIVFVCVCPLTLLLCRLLDEEIASGSTPAVKRRVQRGVTRRNFQVRRSAHSRIFRLLLPLPAGVLRLVYNSSKDNFRVVDVRPKQAASAILCSSRLLIFWLPSSSALSLGRYVLRR